MTGTPIASHGGVKLTATMVCGTCFHLVLDIVDNPAWAKSRIEPDLSKLKAMDE